MNKKKNILEINNLLNNESIDNFSDEFNNLNEIKKDTNSKFNINLIFKDISKCLNNYKNNNNLSGEIITFKISDGNAWITIKIEDFQLTSVFWKIINDKNYNEMKLIKSGDNVNFIGSFGIMKKNLNIYFNIKSMNKIGKGDYLDMFQQYKIKIKELNLGVPKKILNYFPYTIGIITALEGAAIQDILQTFKLDNFLGKIIIKNSIVQGLQCSKSLINSIEWFECNNSEKIDLLMITRGGGSYEDLVGFSNWDLIVKIASTKFITLSAVGHQTDSQLSDDVADYKFATPSIGAKFIIETQYKYLNYMYNYKNSINNILENYQVQKKKLIKITENYNTIIKKYDIMNISLKLKIYSKIINNIFDKYNNAKNKFYDKLTSLKPSIFRNSELISIKDFIDLDKNKSIKPKKIEINFIDGKIHLLYRIIEYELYD